jgi:Ca2+-transporting ATPase
MSTVIVKATGEAGTYDRRIHIKGASEIVMDACSHYINADGIIMPLTDEMKGTLQNVITRFA